MQLQKITCSIIEVFNVFVIILKNYKNKKDAARTNYEHNGTTCSTNIKKIMAKISNYLKINHNMK